MTPNQVKCLQRMEINIWKERSIREEIGDESSRLQDLKNKVKKCTLCTLHKTRKNVVFGAGDKKANLLIIGGSTRCDGRFRRNSVCRKSG